MSLNQQGEAVKQSFRELADLDYKFFQKPGYTSEDWGALSARFDGWAIAVDLFSDGKKSLDYRMSGVPRIRESIIGKLRWLNENLTEFISEANGSSKISEFFMGQPIGIPHKTLYNAKKSMKRLEEYLDMHPDNHLWWGYMLLEHYCEGEIHTIYTCEACIRRFA